MVTRTWIRITRRKQNVKKRFDSSFDDPVQPGYVARGLTTPRLRNRRNLLDRQTLDQCLQCLSALVNGELLLLWSSWSAGGYTVGVARSASGQLLGPWLQDPQPLYSDDGGHCMTFRDFEGKPWLSLHHPNPTPDERPVFLPLAEDTLLLSRPMHPHGKMS